ncbi:ABATE domain-containing protein [Nocardia sp. NPDC006630]|uniref:ABATE domain-containing protein n=1 Tax=Nocardia sp. NPDC006630 TaxID=3157181 RepID=UPI0033BB7830
MRWLAGRRPNRCRRVCSIADPPGRLTDVEHYRAILRHSGHNRLADELAEPDLPRLQALRERLRPVFHAQTPGEATALVNALLRESAAVPQLVDDAGAKPALQWGTTLHGPDALDARLPGALADFLARQGHQRLGGCTAAPCRCVFADRTRPGTRKYCCDQCNDRAAAAAHYRRNRRQRPSDR